MKLSINKLLALLTGGSLITVSSAGWATVTMTLATGVQTVTIPLSPPVISAGGEVPVGTVLYQASLVMKDGYAEAKWQAADVGKYLYFTTSTNVTNTPYPLASLASGPYSGGVYETGIPGIGVAILLSATSTSPLTTTKRFAENQSLLGSELGGRFTFNGLSSTRHIALIKTGPLTPGSYNISAANFPLAREGLDVTQSSHANAAVVTGLPQYFWNYSFQGNITVSTQTCTTPNVAVTMGTYEIAEYFRALNSTTPWKDASITLTNCPTFYGFYNSKNAPLLMNYNTGIGNSTTSINNSIGVRLRPITEVIDAANGIMAIDSTVAGAASGVGIQIGWGNSSQTPALFTFGAEQTLTLPKDGSPTIRVPLAARYVQTDARPTPGRANGKAVFTINYY